MNEKKGTVKTIFGFILVLVLIAGALFGIKLPYEAEDVMSIEETVIDAEQSEQDVVDTLPTVEDTDSESFEDTTSAEDTQENVESSDDEVADTPNDETIATEGDVENA